MVSQSRLRPALIGAVTTALLVGLGLGELPAVAGQEHATVVADVPSAATPDVNDGTVSTIAEVGSRIYLGGDFTNATSAGESVAMTRNNILAFDRADGDLDPGFVPILDGEKLVAQRMTGGHDRHEPAGAASDERERG